MQKTVFFIIALVFFVSCEQKVKTNDSSDAINSEDVVLADFDRIIQEIEERIPDATEITSLEWQKITETHGSDFLHVSAFLNADGKAMKIVEYYRDGDFRPQGEKIYYLSQGEIVAFTENMDIWKDSLTAYYKEIRTHFENGVPVLTEEKTADTYDEAPFEEWYTIDLVNPSLERANKILNGEGEFEPHFISSIQGDNTTFILVGEPKEKDQERYTTALQLNEITPFLEDLIKNEETYKFKPVDIQFMVVGDGVTTPIFRVLTDIQWKE